MNRRKTLSGNNSSGKSNRFDVNSLKRHGRPRCLTE
jgi:hypothetical protein